MVEYRAPLRDMRFVLNELHGGAGTEALPVDTILEEAAKLCEEVLFPLNRSGDEEGATYENGVVRTPQGFRDAYRAFAEGGWTSITANPDFGGQGLPETIATLVEEMICSANNAFGLYPGLAHGAIRALQADGTEELKQRFLPKLVAGTWGATMCLTEPQCGTDLGLCRTRAVAGPDGAYRITGTKIFISGGEHDLTENIVHLILARRPEAPAGIKGISLFVVPKLIDGKRNGVSCGAIEHKMGNKASATCVMNFDEATGWMVGEPEKGMRSMFVMMNTARLAVGLQGLALAEVSYQNAVAYARERLQGRSLAGVKRPDLPADPIISHPDVRRMLLTMRATVEGCRALAIWVAAALDAGDEDRVALLTPVVKALFTDLGFEATNLGVQVFGGHGYIRENGMEQFVRDCRISQIYEGTNGVQALDLVGRKLPAEGGKAVRRFFRDAAQAIEGQPFAEPVGKALGRLQQATLHLAQGTPADAGAAAVEYLRLFGLVALGVMWVRMAAAAQPKAETDPFYAAKLVTARFFMERILPQTGALFAAIMSGGEAIIGFPDEGF